MKTTPVKYSNGIIEQSKLSCALRDDYFGYCQHPFVEKDTLECEYGLTDDIVPNTCPLKESDLIIKLEHKDTSD